ncbi:hypothetical protein APA_1198 [Pseudanabaena sp. lw0831]|uniref:cyclic nucleotide-binding domain-containing protein n=1 Tax=Pseudanabaena sp. lw0831 TaxID=1357935 RepID=UPI001914F614|nr:cyclic nucleotide-binding domain-containing protein [Pseudanabaena sp. lw0831]GBO53291.1 hypothetical protein APA_1198 [Pseudanabaena sp. lw0831]
MATKKNGNGQGQTNNDDKDEGIFAVLGMDIVAFSTLKSSDQMIQVIDQLHEWIVAALDSKRIPRHEITWSPAGDGGYLTFQKPHHCSLAFEVAFFICEEAKKNPKNGMKIQLRFGLHSGRIKKNKDFSGIDNVWGDGINITSRILAISAPSQLLASNQYIENCIKNTEAENGGLIVGDSFYRTMKHGQEILVSNLHRGDTCLNKDDASALRWQCIGGLWKKMSQEYAFLIQDSIKSNDFIAALAAGKLLLDFGYKDGTYLLDSQKDPVKDLCNRVSQYGKNRPKNAPSDGLFSKMSPEVLKNVLKFSSPLLFKAGDVICEENDDSDSCFFPVSGTIYVHLQGGKKIRIEEGQIIGEFSLWIPEIKRTATLKAHDEGLCLKINTEQFRKLLPPEGSNFTTEVYSIIKNRIINNILDSKRFFNNADGIRHLLECEKYYTGTQLDLDKKTYIIFHGKVEIKPCSTTFAAITGKIDKLEISVEGHFGSEQVVGIVAGTDRIDGKFATVLTETVAVSISQDKLIALQEDSKQEDSKSLKKIWQNLFTSRLTEIYFPR